MKAEQLLGIVQNRKKQHLTYPKWLTGAEGRDIMRCLASLVWPCGEKGKDHYLRKAAELPVPGKVKRGKSTQRWKDNVKKDLE